jgi:hypothetical protein
MSGVTWFFVQSSLNVGVYRSNPPSHGLHNRGIWAGTLHMCAYWLCCWPKTAQFFLCFFPCFSNVRNIVYNSVQDVKLLHVMNWWSVPWHGELCVGTLWMKSGFGYSLPPDGSAAMRQLQSLWLRTAEGLCIEAMSNQVSNSNIFES